MRLGKFYDRLLEAGLADRYEAAHARLAVEYLAVCHHRLKLQADGKLEPLPARSQHAADMSYFDTTTKLCDGLERVLQSYQDSDDPQKKRIYGLWNRELLPSAPPAERR